MSGVLAGIAFLTTREAGRNWEGIGRESGRNRKDSGGTFSRGNVEGMWRECGGNVEGMWRECGGNVEGIWFFVCKNSDSLHIPSTLPPHSLHSLHIPSRKSSLPIPSQFPPDSLVVKKLIPAKTPDIPAKIALDPL